MCSGSVSAPLGMRRYCGAIHGTVANTGGVEVVTRRSTAPGRTSRRYSSVGRRSLDDSSAMVRPSGDTNGACVPGIVVSCRDTPPPLLTRNTWRSDGRGAELT